MIFSLISSTGIAAFVFPESAPWSLLLCLIVSILNVCIATNHKAKLFALVVSVSVVIAVVSVTISASLAIAFLSAMALVKRFPYAAVGILLLQSSYASSFQAILSDQLHVINLEAAGPGVLACLVMLVVQNKFSWKKLSLLLAPLFIVFCGNSLVISPWFLMAGASVPALVLAGTAAKESLPKGREEKWQLWLILSIVFISLLGWIFTPPRVPDSTFVLLPTAPQSPDAKFYQNYAAAIKFADIDLKVVRTVEQIPSNSLLILPWLTVPISDDKGQDLLPRIRELAISRGWTVILIGEHTNLGNVGDRIASLVGNKALRNNLTTPPKNTDNSGPLRVGNFKAWPHSSIFNRGASIKIDSPLDRILLAGDGWWAERDIGEWMWVGDYLWQSSDRNGRIVLGASISEGNARWVVIGDTSPFINQQIISDPRAAKMIIRMATLLPLFILDLWILVICASCVLITRNNFKNYMPAIILVPILFVAIDQERDAPWRYLWNQESGFNENNFNKTISLNPEFVSSDWRFIRSRNELTGDFNLPNETSVIFGLIKDQVNIGGISIGSCHRIGSLKSNEGPYLMDAQACQVTGEAEILLGDNEEAAAIRVKENGNKAIFIFDRKFLSQKAPPENSNWLLQIIKKSH